MYKFRDWPEDQCRLNIPRDLLRQQNKTWKSCGNAFRSLQVRLSQEFVYFVNAIEKILGREIPEDFAQNVDHTNEFPNEMWRKLGEAG